MNIGFNQIRSAISTKMSTLSGFTNSRYPPEFLGRNPGSLAHLVYAIGIGGTTSAGNRQQPSRGIQLSTAALVKFAYRMRPTDAYPTSYDEALSKEREVILKLLSSYTGTLDGLQIQYVGSRRSFEQSFEYMIHDLNFLILHTIKE